MKIINKADTADINIEGIIGIPEAWQFESVDGRVSTFEKLSDALCEITAPLIVVNIRSIGGSVNDALLIHDTIVATNKSITTRCYGYTASAATIIAQAASPGSREMSANSLYLVHKSSSMLEGNADEIESAVDILHKTDDRLANLYAARSGKPAGSFMELMSENNGNGRWLTPAEALEYGLIDKVVTMGELTNYAKDGVDVSKLPALPEDMHKEISLKPKNMKVQRTWNAILDFFGFDKESENELTEAQVEKLNGELASKTNEVSNLTVERSTLKADNEAKEGVIANLGKEIETLNKKVSNLEAERDQLKAKATDTPAKEDPAPQGVSNKVNNEAYNKDAQNLK